MKLRGAEKEICHLKRQLEEKEEELAHLRRLLTAFKKSYRNKEAE
jgi:hypothetical protein